MINIIGVHAKATNTIQTTFLQKRQFEVIRAAAHGVVRGYPDSPLVIIGDWNSKWYEIDYQSKFDESFLWGAHVRDIFAGYVHVAPAPGVPTHNYQGSWSALDHIVIGGDWAPWVFDVGVIGGPESE